MRGTQLAGGGILPIHIYGIDSCCEAGEDYVWYTTMVPLGVDGGRA